MNINIIRDALRRAGTLFEVTGAESQAGAIAAVEQVLADCGDETVEDFVDKTGKALAAPRFEDLTPDVIAAELEGLRTDKAKFALHFAKLQQAGLRKEKVAEVASLYSGARPTAFKTKASALKAIKQTFDDKVYLASKQAMNEGVTPW